MWPAEEVEVRGRLFLEFEAFVMSEALACNYSDRALIRVRQALRDLAVAYFDKSEY